MELTYFYLENCPYCRQATAWLDELRQEDLKYSVPLRKIEESHNAALSDKYDYYLVPTFFAGEEKLHEGAATKEKLRDMLERYLAITATS